MRSLFHFAFNVTDLNEARRFYGGVLGCREGRSTDTWVDFDFYDHQISLHLGTPFKTERTGHVGNVLVPMPHFGLVLTLPDWQAMASAADRCGHRFCSGATGALRGRARRAVDDVLLRPVWQPAGDQGVCIAGRAVREVI
jgi:extradiol dioxygenase family protein